MFQLESERLHVEVWDNENWCLNAWTAYNSIPFVDIVDGKMEHEIKCYPYDEHFKPGKLVATVNLMVKLSEIWDFNLEFMDWKTSSL